MLGDKIKTLEELSEILAELKNRGKKIVLCHGCFDLIHYGHIQHFLAAKEQGDILVVTLTPDRFIQKGPERPFFNEDIRLKHLASIECIDYVALNEWPTAIETIKIIKPDVYAKGKEVLDNKDVDKLENGVKTISNLSAEEAVVKSCGGNLYLTDEITFSSSKIINRITSSMPEESKDFLSIFKNKFKIDHILEVLDSLKDLKVLAIGDAILDEYTYTESLDKSGKTPVVAYKFLNSEIYLGGVFALARHLSGFVKNVSLVTCVGDDCFESINNSDSLSENIEKNILVKKNAKTLTKKRYLDNYKGLKLFEVYNDEGLELDEENEKKIIDYLNENIPKFDLIIVADFGHGMMSENVLDCLYKSSKFLGVNCQLNAGNMGYNFITKYKRADFVSLNEKELRLPFQSKVGDIQVPIIKLSNSLNLDKINITLGKTGSVYYERGNYFQVPSFTKDPLDTIGAGDAVLSITSMLAYKNIDPQILPFLGNCVGALAVNIVGNKESIDPAELRRFVSYILK